MNNKRSTMKDVAKLAGVTQATVSYVINNSANISEEVRTRVYDAIRELNYTPNYNARALKTSSSDIIGIILPDIVNQYYSQMAEYLENLLIQTNHHTMIYTTSYNPQYEKDIIQRLLSYDVQGIIVLYQLVDNANWNILKLSGKTIIALEGGSYCCQAGIPCIHTDGFSGGYMATKYLLDKGAQKIALIQQTAANEELYDRFLGYAQAMKDAELYRSDDVYYIDITSNRYDEYERIGYELIQQPYDAVVTVSDLIAVGIIRQLITHGKRVPEDIRVVGYDNVPLARLFIPALTTIARPLEDICKRIIQMMFSADAHSASSRIVFKPRLRVRESA